MNKKRYEISRTVTFEHQLEIVVVFLLLVLVLVVVSVLIVRHLHFLL